MKMEAIKIETLEEYFIVRNRGIEPLFHYNELELDHDLRIELQNKMFSNYLFGEEDIQAANNRFFRFVWDHKSHYCEECLKPLGDQFAAIYCSHILSRGAYPDMAHDPRNINLLCPACHAEWENGTRSKMLIYPRNKKTIKKLKEEYGMF